MLDSIAVDLLNWLQYILIFNFTWENSKNSVAL